MARVSDKQRANIERYKKAGWKGQDIEKSKPIWCGKGNRSNCLDSGVLHPEFDPPAPKRLSTRELSAYISGACGSAS